MVTVASLSAAVGAAAAPMAGGWAEPCTCWASSAGPCCMTACWCAGEGWVSLRCGLVEAERRRRV